MIASVYPHGRSIRHARPAPTAAKSADGRIAAYGCLRGDDLGRTSVEWTLHPVSIDAEVRYLNSRSSLDTVPTSSGIETNTSADVPNRTIRVFLCHSSGDKDTVRALHARLQAAGCAPWLDELDILLGEDWQRVITVAVRNSDVVLVCLSRGSVSTVGYLQREIRTALDLAEEQPEGGDVPHPADIGAVRRAGTAATLAMARLLRGRGARAAVVSLTQAGLALAPTGT